MIQILKPSKGANSESCYQSIKVKHINRRERRQQSTNAELWREQISFKTPGFIESSYEIKNAICRESKAE